MQLSQAIGTSVARKVIVALTGLGLCVFTLAHLAGNFLVFISPDIFNLYGHTLTSNNLIYVAEAGLALTFLVHFVIAMKLTYENKIARGSKYYMKKATGRGSTFASSTMIYSGMIILFFVVYHLFTVKFGAHYTTTVDGVEMRDLYRLLLEHFSSTVNTVLYIVAVCALGLHVSHGLWSAFQSVGFNSVEHSSKIKFVALAFGVFVSIGYSSIAIWAMLQNGAY